MRERKNSRIRFEMNRSRTAAHPRRVKVPQTKHYRQITNYNAMSVGGQKRTFFYR